MKVVVVPDSFKGSMTSMEACLIIKKEILRHHADWQVVTIPIADGGEGSLECIRQAVGGEIMDVVARDSFGVDKSCSYLIKGSTAYIELAQCAGLGDIAPSALNPSLTTTYGVGQLIMDAIACGIKKIVLMIGGSSTNDCGAGMAAACGAKFYDENGLEFIPTGGTLDKVKNIDNSELMANIAGVEFVTMCDVTNVLYGDNGAAYVYARQKGADDEMIEMLDAGLAHISSIIERDLHVNVDDIPGGGAAGGVGAGSVAFFGANLVSGINTMLDAVGFERIVYDADILITGEGRVDSQSLSGKVIDGLLKRTPPLLEKIFVVVGDILGDMTQLYERGVTAVLSTNRRAIPFESAKITAKEDLRLTIDTLMRLI